MTFRAWLSTDPSVKFDNRKAGLVALRMVSTDVPDAKLIVEFDEEGNYRDEEFSIVDGSPVKVIGSHLWWGRQERPGEQEALATWCEWDRYSRVRHLKNGVAPTQSEMDLLTDFVQWLGTTVGSGFMAEIQRRTHNRLNNDQRRKSLTENKVPTDDSL